MERQVGAEQLEVMRQPNRWLQRQWNQASVWQAEEQTKERLLKDALSVYSFPLRLSENPRVQEVIGQLDNLPNFRQASL